jgi:hypothetical protein
MSIAGSLDARDATVSLSAELRCCPSSVLSFQLPVGITAESAHRHAASSVDGPARSMPMTGRRAPAPGAKSTIRIRADQPFVLDFSSKPRSLASRPGTAPGQAKLECQGRLMGPPWPSCSAHKEGSL